MANTTITLLEPIEGPGPVKDAPTVRITQVILRAPRYSDMMRLGEPRAYGRSEGGIVFTSEKEEVLDAYIQRLLVEPKDPALLQQCGLADAIALKDAVFDFFEAARVALLKQSLEASSSDTKS